MCPEGSVKAAQSPAACQQEHLGPVGASTFPPGLTGATGPVRGQIQTQKLVGGPGTGPLGHTPRGYHRSSHVCIIYVTFLCLGFPIVQGMLVPATGCCEVLGPSLGTRKNSPGREPAAPRVTGRWLVGTGRGSGGALSTGPGTSPIGRSHEDGRGSLWMWFTQARTQRVHLTRPCPALATSQHRRQS